MMHKIGDRVSFCPPGKGADEVPTEGVIVAIVEPGQDSLPLIKQWYADNVSDKHRDVAMIKAVIATVQFSFIDTRYLVTSLNKFGQREWHSIEIVSSSSNSLGSQPMEPQTKKGGRRSVPIDEQKTAPVEEEVILRRWEPVGPLITCDSIEAVFGDVTLRSLSGCLVGITQKPVSFWGTCSLIARSSDGHRLASTTDTQTAVCGFYLASDGKMTCVENLGFDKRAPTFWGYKAAKQDIYKFLRAMRPPEYTEHQRKLASASQEAT